MIDGHRVALLISTRNRAALVRDAIGSVLSGTTVPDEIVVVDQSDVPNETLASMAVPSTAQLRYLHSRTTGLSVSRNIAFAHATHPIAVVLDDDCLVDEQWLETLVRSLIAEGPHAVVTGRVLADAPDKPGRFAPSLHTGDELVRYQGRQVTDPLATFNFALRTSAYRVVGEFDPRIGPGTAFPAAEDNDYGYRLLRSGRTIVFDPSAVVYHRAWRDESTYVSLRYAYGRGQGAYYAKHLAQRDWYMLWKLAHALKRRGARMLQGDREGIIGETVWVAGWAAGAVTWRRQHRGVTRAPHTYSECA